MNPSTTIGIVGGIAIVAITVFFSVDSAALLWNPLGLLLDLLVLSCLAPVQSWRAASVVVEDVEADSLWRSVHPLVGGKIGPSFEQTQFTVNNVNREVAQVGAGGHQRALVSRSGHHAITR